MEIRIRATGQVMTEGEFRAYQRANDGPTWDRTTDEVLEALGADVVFEGPQPTGGEFWQFPMRQGVEQRGDGKWYTKWGYGPIFTDNEDKTAAEQQAEWIAQKTAEKQLALKESIIAETQKRLDDFAKTRRYDGILSACTYATSTVEKFRTEGQYCVNARDLTWATLYQVLEEVQAGARPVPTGFADIEPLLPELTWPN